MTIELKNQSPIESADLTLSLLVLTQEYRRLMARLYGAKAVEGVKVYIQDIRAGTVITDTVDMVANYRGQVDKASDEPNLFMAG